MRDTRPRVAPPRERTHPLGNGPLVRDIESELRVYLPTYLFTAYWRKRKYQWQIAEDLGVNQSTVCRWLTMLGYNQRVVLDEAARTLEGPAGP